MFVKITVATPILFDPTSPFNHLFGDILASLTQNGHSVTRLLAVENEIQDEQLFGLATENIPVKRKVAAHGNIITRYINDSLTNFRMARKIKSTGADILFEDASYSSHFAVRAAKRAGMQVVTMLQDVWPDNAVQSGLLREGSLLYRFFEFFQQYVYKHSDRLICISDDMKAFLVSKGVPAEKISVIYNWGYSDDTVSINWEENAFVKKYDLSRDKFYAVYAGNIGRMQNLELVVEAAELLQKQENIRFLIIGTGAREENIRQMVAEKGLSNVEFLPFQPSQLATSVYSAAGVNLIPLVKGGTKTALPSKTGVVLSCGRPAIFTFGEGTTFGAMLEESGAGMSVDPEDPKKLASAIEKIAEERSSDPEPAYGVFRKLFTRSTNMQKYCDIITGEL